MSSGPKTSSIPRPERAARSTTVGSKMHTRVRRGEGGDDTALADLTRPIAADRQLVTSRPKRWLLTMAALGVVAALLLALFMLPVKTWIRQQSAIAEKKRQLEVLSAANEQLTRDVARLETPTGAQEAARSHLGLVAAGEQRISVLPDTGPPLPLPAGWPYDAVTQIITVRTTAVSAAPATPGTATPAATAPAAPANPAAPAAPANPAAPTAATSPANPAAPTAATSPAAPAAPTAGGPASSQPAQP